ncbi:hypothetical protein E2562_025540 [Oryza meyeriana var. granulata]|uniref:Uncharacterized protein n=1 Tax=Oryza meyeriana var. granulata TaxID=110450 RepID=A0A6G1FCA4_9ORYZ|nr:hypothetical protein E2562_025540 [Oryza meyeriana var. granulata]
MVTAHRQEERGELSVPNEHGAPGEHSGDGADDGRKEEYELPPIRGPWMWASSRRQDRLHEEDAASARGGKDNKQQGRRRPR